MSNIVERLIGVEVKVHYLSDNTLSDKGVIIEADDSSIRLERSGNTDLVIPMSAVRIIAMDAKKATRRSTLPKTVDQATESSEFVLPEAQRHFL